jgi:hypothetical protein
MDPQNREKLFKKLEELSTISLRTDPAAHGLSDMSEKLSDIVNKHSTACILTNKVIKIFGEKRNLLDTAKSMFKIRYNRTLAENEMVKAGGSQAERVAIACSLLQEDQQKLTELQNEVNEWEGIKECAENCLKTLVIAKESISKQQSIIMKQLEMGEVGPGFGSH